VAGNCWRLVELPANVPPLSSSDGRLVEGVEEFDLSIAAARDDQRPQLQRLRDWAVELHREGLVTLQTFQGRVSNRRNLLPRLSDERVGLVTIYNSGGTPSLQLFRKVLERRAPKTLPEIERIVAPQPLGQGTLAKNITDELLETLTEAHRGQWVGDRETKRVEPDSWRGMLPNKRAFGSCTGPSLAGRPLFKATLAQVPKLRILSALCIPDTSVQGGRLW